MMDGVAYYALFNTLAYAAAGLIYHAEARRKGYPLDVLVYIALGALAGALVGSRLGSALFVYPDVYIQHPLYLLVPQVGGKTLVGGLIGGYVGVVIAKRLCKFTRSTGDLFAPGLALGIGIGRIGCFLNGCCYGTPTDLPWAVAFKGVRCHPTQLYESLFGFLLFMVLWHLRRRLTVEGDLFRVFLAAYAFFRFWIEFIRGDAVAAPSGLSLAQWVCLGVLLVLFARLSQRKGE